MNIYHLASNIIIKIIMKLTSDSSAQPQRRRSRGVERLGRWTERNERVEEEEGDGRLELWQQPEREGIEQRREGDGMERHLEIPDLNKNIDKVIDIVILIKTLS